MLRLPDGARKHALLTALEQSGSLIGPIDIQIASVALSRGAVLVTHNTREFERVAGLLLQDWY